MKELLTKDVSHLEKIGTLKPFCKFCFLNKYSPGVVPARVVVIMAGFIIVFCLTTVFGYDPHTGEYYIWAFVIGGLCVTCIVLSLLTLGLYEQNKYLESFQVGLLLNDYIPLV